MAKKKQTKRQKAAVKKPLVKTTIENPEKTKTSAIITANVKPKEESFDMPIAKENYILLLVGIVIIVIGYFLMAGGASEDPNVFNADELFSFRRITLAPIIILFGFIFEIWAIMRRPKEKIKTTE